MPGAPVARRVRLGVSPLPRIGLSITHISKNTRNHADFRRRVESFGSPRGRSWPKTKGRTEANSCFVSCDLPKRQPASADLWVMDSALGGGVGEGAISATTPRHPLSVSSTTNPHIATSAPLTKRKHTCYTAFKRHIRDWVRAWAAPDRSPGTSFRHPGPQSSNWETPSPSPSLRSEPQPSPRRVSAPDERVRRRKTGVRSSRRSLVRPPAFRTTSKMVLVRTRSRGYSRL